MAQTINGWKTTFVAARPTGAWRATKNGETMDAPTNQKLLQLIAEREAARQGAS